MKIAQIDSASLHSVVSGLQRGRTGQISEWERTSLAEVSLSLLFKQNINIPAPPKIGHNLLHSDVDNITEILHESVQDIASKPKDKKWHIEQFKNWINKNSGLINQRFNLLQNDPSYEDFIRWSIEKAWPYHVTRLGSLIDHVVFNDIASILDWPKKESIKIKKHCEDVDHIRLLSKSFKRDNILPPQEFIAGYMLSTLLRGRYYLNIAFQSDKKFIWHALRNYIIDPVEEITELDLLNNKLVEKYLAGLICYGAMQEKDNESAVKSWAGNICKIKNQTIIIPQESDPERAVSLAVKIAKNCKLEIKWPMLDNILDKANEFFILPLFCIATGTVLFVPTGSLEFLLLEHSILESTIRPYAKKLEHKLKFQLPNSTMYMKKISKQGVQRIFAISTKDKKKLI
jgi:hypothetical protein